MNGSPHPDEALRAAWLDGSLTPEQRARLDAWLADKPVAAREQAAMETVLADLAGSRAPEVDSDLLGLARAGLSRRLRETPQLSLPEPTAQPSPAGGRVMRLVTRVGSLAAMFLLGLILAKQFTPTLPLEPVTGDMASADVEDGVDGHDPLRPVSLVGGQEGARAMHSTMEVSDLSLEHGTQVRILLNQVQKFAIEGGAGEENIQDYLSYIIRNDNDRQRRVLALSALAGKPLKPQVREVLVHVMTHDPDGEIRLRTAGLLSTWVDETIVAQGFMKALVDDPSADVRQYAMTTLSASREGQARGSRGN
jgi:hypothetical protein